MSSKSPDKFQELGKGKLKRKKTRSLGLFIDGTGLDRATRRIKRKVDMAALIKGVCAGMEPTVARYYTLIPYEDDSRHLAFLDAVSRTGLKVVIKRLPPKGINRLVSIDVEMAADIIAFSLGHQNFSSLSELDSLDSGKESPKGRPVIKRNLGPQNSDSVQRSSKSSKAEAENTDSSQILKPGVDIERIVTVLCPSREVAYPITLSNELGVSTVTADFGQFNNNDILKSASKWIDLSDSETIWRD